MRRNHSDAGGRTESSTELIARITAERQSRSSSSATGRHSRHAGPKTETAADTTVIDRITSAAGITSTALVSRTAGLTSPAVVTRVPAPPVDDDVDTAALEVVPAEPDEPADIAADIEVDFDDDRDEDWDDDGADDEHDDAAPVRRSRFTVRRLAPLAVGAAVMLVATTIATLVQPPEDDQIAAPELSNNAIVAEEPELNRLDEVTPTTEPVVPPPPVALPEAPPEPEPEPAPAARPAGPNEGTTAAKVHGWTLVEGDEFNGGMSDRWQVYDGPGHGGNGRRVPDAVSVENGALIIRGDDDGNTGGMAWDDGQTYGKWEMRARFPEGDEQYHPVLILWPSAENWPEGGEVDFAETNSAADDVMFFLHYGADNSQVFDRKVIDITQWHNYAVEWVDGRITGYIDGEKWFESTDDDTLPPGDMHATIQLDYFPDEGDPEPSEMHVDFMRIYE